MVEVQQALHGATTVRVVVPSTPVASQPAETRQTYQWQPIDTITDLNALRPKRGRGAGTDGPVTLLRVLHDLAIYAAQVRGYHHSVSQVVIHTSRELLAAACDVDKTTVTRWSDTLEAAGVLSSREHYGKAVNADGEVLTWRTGTLYAISMRAGHTARLSYDDLHHEWRDLVTDREAGQTAYNALKQINNEFAVQDEEINMQLSSNPKRVKRILNTLKQWIVTSVGGLKILKLDNPLDSDGCNIEKMELNTVSDVAYSVSSILTINGNHRAETVLGLAKRLALLLDDEKSERWYCKMLWGAYKTERDGMGGLRILETQLLRLVADIREWDDLRRPAALLASRLKNTPRGFASRGVQA